MARRALAAPHRAVGDPASRRRPLGRRCLAVWGLLALLPAAVAAATSTAGVTVRLLQPPEGLLVGGLRVGAVVEGAGVARVRFLLDGRELLSKVRPPYGVSLDLGQAPRPHEVVAIACEASGDELARDRLLLNAGPFRFAVRLISPVTGRSYGDRLEAQAEVVLPIGEPLDRVEFHLGEELAAVATEPPYTAELEIASPEPTYVRAVAVLADGSTAEDLVAINTDSGSDQLDISFVELYASVLNRQRKPVDGLVAADFRVTENGVPQSLRRFEQVLDRPLHLGFLLDTSLSMLEELPESRRTALEFFERMLRPSDRATVITFADEPRVRVPFAADLETLAAGLEDLEAKGETTLYDSLAFGLYYFGGLKGKRAMVLLTDGADSLSRFSLTEVIEYAQRLGVALYPIGLTSGSRDVQSELALRRMASETGGSVFFIQRASELDHAYERIETELRSQYLLGYQSTSTAPGEFRKVEVELVEPGLTARTIPGYYP
jgi:VWFA-related protein